MSRLVAVPALALLLGPAAMLLAADAPPKGDKDLEGTWEAVACVRDGKDLPPDKNAPVAAIEGDQLTLKVGDESRKATLKVDATKTPRTMDVTLEDGPHKGETVKALYQIKGDELKVCHGEPGTDRPTDVSSKEGSGLTVMTFKRVKK
jgi:uncharacterized protein (TIGR03067 family)